MDTNGRVSARKNVAIVGFASTHRNEAPFNDPAWEVWGVNDAWTWMPRADRWFELHARWIYEWHLRRARGHVDALQAFDGPVYMLEHRDDIPNSIEYPFDEIVAATPWVTRLLPRLADCPADCTYVSSRSDPYLTSTIAYMIALAIHEGFEVIGLWGVDMSSQAEYMVQRPCCEYLLGIAQGRGVKVIVPETCKLVEGPLYGRGAINPGGERITTQDLESRIRWIVEQEQYLSRKLQDSIAKMARVDGAIQATRELMKKEPRIVVVGKQRIRELEAKQAEIEQEVTDAQVRLEQNRGAAAETRYWIGYTPQGGDPRLATAVTVGNAVIVNQSTSIAAYLAADEKPLELIEVE